MNEEAIIALTDSMEKLVEAMIKLHFAKEGLIGGYPEKFKVELKKVKAEIVADLKSKLVVQ